MIPLTWGILVTGGDPAVALNRIRAAKPNRNLDKWSLIRLMWKSDASEHSGDVIVQYAPICL